MYEAPEVCEMKNVPNPQSGASLFCTRPGTGVWLIFVISEGGVQLCDCQEVRTKTRDGGVSLGASVSIPQEGIVAFQGMVKRIMTSHMEEGQKEGKPVGRGQGDLSEWLRTCERILRTLVGVAWSVGIGNGG